MKGPNFIQKRKQEIIGLLSLKPGNYLIEEASAGLLPSEPNFVLKGTPPYQTIRQLPVHCDASHECSSSSEPKSEKKPETKPPVQLESQLTNDHVITASHAPHVESAAGDDECANNKYVEFLDENATQYRDIKIESVQVFPKYYKLMRINQNSNRRQQLLICKHGGCRA
jgi:hypothetical protein